MKPRPQETTTTYVGDFAKCARLEPIGREMVAKLKQFIKLSRGRIQQAWSPTVTTADGDRIRAVVSFNTAHIYIETFGRKKTERGEGYYFPIEEECFCTCDLSFGTITKVHTEKLDDWIPLYDVECCYKGESLVNYENILASDFSIYRVGQNVLVMAYHDFLYGCCALGEDYADGVATSCQPAVESRLKTDLLWRATYRIVPICPDAIDEWEQTKLAKRKIEDGNQL
jgi:hypothetical protein